MKTTCTQLILFATSAALYLGTNGAPAQGTAFTYQGRLNVNGAPASGTYDFRYRLALDQFGNSYYGSSVLATNQVISNGLFTATLDFGAGAFNGGSYWLEVDVRTNGAGGYTALSPLQAVTPAPYAIFSGTSSIAVNATTAATATTATTATTASAVGSNGVNGVAIQNNAVTSPKIATGQVVKSLTAGASTLYDNVTLAAGNNVTITPNGQTLTIAASGGQSWSLTGNSGTTPATQFLGTTDNQPLELRVNGMRALRLAPAGVNGAPNMIGGSPTNTVDLGVEGAVIAGGGATNSGYSTPAVPNHISASFSSIGGGYANTIQSGAGVSTVAGGAFNTISSSAASSTIGGGQVNVIQNGASFSSIGGGINNTNLANADYAIIPGGLGNVAGFAAFAAGQNAKATHDGAFVWADSTAFVNFNSTHNNEFAVRCTGGTRFVTGVDGSGNPTATAFLNANDPSWHTASDRNVKKDFGPVDTRELLEKLVQVPVTRWHYKWESDSETLNIGPMAQDFVSAFYPGRDDKSISTLEFDGVELAAIQGLNRKLEEQLRERDTEVQALKARLDKLERVLSSLSANR